MPVDYSRKSNEYCKPIQLLIQHADIVCIKIGKMYQNRRFFEYLNIISLQAGRSTYCMTINEMLLKACFPIGLATSSYFSE